MKIKIKRTSTTNLTNTKLLPYFRALLYKLSSLLPDSLSSYQHLPLACYNGEHPHYSRHVSTR